MRNNNERLCGRWGKVESSIWVAVQEVRSGVVAQVNERITYRLHFNKLRDVALIPVQTGLAIEIYGVR